MKIYNNLTWYFVEASQAYKRNTEFCFLDTTKINVFPILFKQSILKATDMFFFFLIYYNSLLL